MHPCDMPHSVHVAPCYLSCACSRGNHGYGARCYIIPLGSTPRVGIRGGHERNRTQPDAPVHGSHYMILIDDANEPHRGRIPGISRVSMPKSFVLRTDQRGRPVKVPGERQRVSSAAQSSHPLAWRHKGYPPPQETPRAARGIPQMHLDREVIFTEHPT